MFKQFPFFILLLFSCGIFCASESCFADYDETKRYLKDADKNRNGVIDKDEMENDGKLRSRVQYYMRKAGYDEKDKPTLDRVLKGAKKRYEEEKERKENSGDSSKSGSSGKKESSGYSINIKGFELEESKTEKKTFGSFGTPLSTSKSMKKTDNIEVEERYMSYAANVIQKYDRNKNGQLDPSEWKDVKWSSDPKASDLNKDGIMTRREMAIRLAKKYPKKSDGDSKSRSSSKGSSDSSGSQIYVNEAKKSYRFAKVEERLPSGLPSWFEKSDLNQDGQVMMSEFSQAWDESKAAEFVKFDRNLDGVITAIEATDD